MTDVSSCITTILTAGKFSYCTEKPKKFFLHYIAEKPEIQDSCSSKKFPPCDSSQTSRHRQIAGGDTKSER